ncbi:hypothetical protein PV05_07782 [Exophiala xenobiotica]|uniref:Protein-ribulosamine 3-kinase n=1 Tax=Exophiala xenobiotica TaxID=348802 RepID=A0A0D2CQ75_9EURO|nr:uncharacterized protein PV05_07782 [Exophiala xenobiotica]KIW52117.1 hypothetical protein PV05_07782 [Exophiala xenobiotica]
MLQGEFQLMKAIYNLLLDFVPKPNAWGTYQSNPDTHFFLCEYRETADDMPDPENFSVQLALLHKNSESHTDEFGQWMPACNKFGASYVTAYRSDVVSDEKHYP